MNIYNKACCYAHLQNVDLAIENLHKAIEIDVDRFCKLIEKETDFDSIRNNTKFNAFLVNNYF